MSRRRIVPGRVRRRRERRAQGETFLLLVNGKPSELIEARSVTEALHFASDTQPGDWQRLSVASTRPGASAPQIESDVQYRRRRRR